MFLGQGVLWQQVSHCLEAAAAAGNKRPLNFGSGVQSGMHNDTQMGSHSTSQTLQGYTERLRTTLLLLGGDSDVAGDDARDSQLPRPSKRQKHNEGGGGRGGKGGPGHRQTMPVRKDKVGAALSLQVTPEIDLPEDLLESLVDIYFARLHPWIPMLHVHQFRQKMADPVQRSRLDNIFYAITSLCIRFSNDERLGDDSARAELAKKCRETVILQSMQSFSVENLQALIICAFDTVCFVLFGCITRLRRPVYRPDMSTD
jgi:hypothetical protein